MTIPKEALEAVLSFLDELAANAAPGKRQTLNPIIIGGSAKLYADGLRASLQGEDAVERVALARDWKTIEEQIATAQGNDFLALIRNYLVINMKPGNDLAPLYIARIGSILAKARKAEPAVARFEERINKYVAQLNATGQADLAHLLRRDSDALLAAIRSGGGE